MNGKPAEENDGKDKETAKMYDIQILSHPIFGNIRTVIIEGKVWFNSKDVTRVLKQQNTNAVIESYVNEDDIRYAKFPTKRGLRTTAVINELGLIALVFESKMRSKQAFKKWILSKTAMEEAIAGDSIETIESDDSPDERIDEIQSVSTPNVIQIFDNSEFGDIRTLMVDGKAYFVGRDVASALGYDENSIRNALKQHVYSEDKRLCKINTPSGKQNATIINESGLYSLILSSNLPSAKRFTHWITSEVIPALQNTGSYTMPNATHSVFTKNDVDVIKFIKECTPEQLSVIKLMLERADCSIDWKMLERSGARTLTLIQSEHPSPPDNPQNKVRHKKPVKFNINESIDEQQLERLTEIFADHIDREIAEKIKISRTAISKYRNGSRAINKDRCKEIIDAFA